MSEEREAFEAWYESEKMKYWLMCADKEMCFGIWQAALEWQARQSAGAPSLCPHGVDDGWMPLVYGSFAPIGDNGAKAYDEGAAIRLRRVLKLLDLENVAPSNDATMMGALFSVLGSVASNLERRASQPAESKRVELTDEQWRIIEAPTGNPLFDAGVHDACNRVRELLDRAAAKGE